MSATNDNFLNKYKLGGSTNQLPSATPLGFYPGSNSYNNVATNARYQQSQNYANTASPFDVLSKAGPNQIYHRPNHQYQVASGGDLGNLQLSGRQNTINEDHNPVLVKKPAENQVHQQQNVRVRYLQPPEPPAHAPIIVHERQLTPPPPLPPIVVRQHQVPPPTPPPLIIRERPPTAPPVALQPTVIERILPPPTPPPRQVIVERIPAPEKPREIIYEKWLPYKQPGERPVVLERGKTYARQPAPKNVIIEYDQPNVNIQRNVYNDGVIPSDPNTYNSARSYGEVRMVDRIHPSELPIPNSSGSYRAPQQVYQPAPQQMYQPMYSQPQSYTQRGPYVGPWNTTYRSSYTGRGYGGMAPF